MPIALKPFDASRDFVAKAFFRAGGVIWKRNQPFDKAYVNERVLRQLYESRKIGYAEDQPASDEPIVADEPGDQSPVEQHEAEIAVEQATGEPDSNETPADAAVQDAPPADEAAAAPDGDAETAAAAADPLDHDLNGEKGGSLPDDTGTPEELIKRLVNRHTHGELFAKASGLKGVSKSMTKAELAAALVDAGRIGDGAA